METTTVQEKKSPMQAEPQKEHEWLQRLVGDWTFEMEAKMGPDQPTEKAGGTERVRSLGGLWIVGEGEGDMPGGGHATTVLTLGYDPVAGHFVGTWVGSMMTHMWIYRGELDRAGKVLTLDSEGPDMTGGKKLAHYRDVIELLSDDHRTLTGNVQDEDGNWREMMVVHYRRA